jgi:hypothetical protein
MAANFISKDEVSQNIVNAFLQRRLQYIITALKKLEIATARHRANKAAVVIDSSTNDEYSVHGYIKGAYFTFHSPILLLKKRRRLLVFFPSLSFSSFFLFFIFSFLLFYICALSALLKYKRMILVLLLAFRIYDAHTSSHLSEVMVVWDESTTAKTSVIFRK